MRKKLVLIAIVKDGPRFYLVPSDQQSADEQALVNWDHKPILWVGAQTQEEAIALAKKKINEWELSKLHTRENT
ncbi:hypothetical protein GCM10027592_56800 [Spirosoma flavus]